MEPKIKNGGGTRTLNGVMWVLSVVSGTILGIVGSFAVSVSSMTDYRWAYNQWIGTDTKITEKEAQEALAWIQNDRWIVHFVDQNAQADLLSGLLLAVVALAILFFAALIVLCVQTGRMNRTADGRVLLSRFDRIWSEALLVLGCGAAGGAVALAVPLCEIWPAVNLKGVYSAGVADAYFFGPSNTVICILCISGMAACIFLAVLSFVSLVKKIKAHMFWEKSFFGGIVLAVHRGFTASDKTMVKVMGLLLGGMLLSMTWFGAVLVLAVIILCVPKLVRQFLEIRRGVSEVKNGNLTYRIPVETDRRGNRGEMARLAEDINEISQASNLAVQNELKNQRMKTELISNVSHDLKTPLTSMVSYIDLLEQEGLDSPNAPEYLRILDEKTQRLRVLTEDLFEAAKASSGAIPVHMESIDLGSLISQSLAEMGERLAAQQLELIVANRCAAAAPQAQAGNADEAQPAADAPNAAGDSGSTPAAGPRVLADGQLLWRVLENLLGNVSKYAQPNSRVYLDISSVKGKETAFDAANGSAAGGFVLLEVKNISRDRLNISADELMERFKRGDESRSTEGSGLGLSIARDLTKLMEGVFEITVDGDLFKASVLLKQA